MRQDGVLDFSGQGHYQSITMPTSQHFMNLAVRGLHWTSVLAYLDDIIIFVPSFWEHQHRLREVCNRRRGAGLKLKPSKCHFAKQSVKFRLMVSILIRCAVVDCPPPPRKTFPPGILLYSRFPPGKSTMRRILPPGKYPTGDFYSRFPPVECSCMAVHWTGFLLLHVHVALHVAL